MFFLTANLGALKFTFFSTLRLSFGENERYEEGKIFHPTGMINNNFSFKTQFSRNSDL